RASTPTHTPAAAPHSIVKATTVSGSSSYTSTSYRYSTVSSGTSTAAATRAKGYSLAKASAITTITPRPNAARNVAMDALGRCGNSEEISAGRRTGSCGAAENSRRERAAARGAALSGEPQRMQKLPAGTSCPHDGHVTAVPGSGSPT